MSPISKNTDSGKSIKVKVTAIIMVELRVSKTGTTATMIIKCKINPSNILSILLSYGFVVTCTKAIITFKIMRKYMGNIKV